MERRSERRTLRAKKKEGINERKEIKCEKKVRNEGGEEIN